MMVECYMEISLSIYHKTDHVVRILHISPVLCHTKRPFFRVYTSFSQNQVPFTIPKGEILRVFVSYQRVGSEDSRIH